MLIFILTFWISDKACSMLCYTEENYDWTEIYEKKNRT